MPRRSPPCPFICPGLLSYRRHPIVWCLVSMPLTLASLVSDVTRAAATFATLAAACSHDVPLKHAPSRDRDPQRQKRRSDKKPDLYADWLASRCSSENGKECLPPGAHRPFTVDNLVIACRLSKSCTSEILSCLWDLHPYRISFMVILDLIRGVFPAFRGYSQALMVDEVRRIILDLKELVLTAITVYSCKN